MSSYYSTHLSAQRLQRVYDIAPPRVQQYLHAEIEHVASHIKPGDSVLELGCGYGRVLKELGERSQATEIIGIDTSIDSLVYGIKDQRLPVSCQLICMDAARLGFRSDAFDVVACIQNGISAFKVEPRQLLAEALRVTKPGGRVLLSSYSPKFWQARMQWFELQSQQGLLGPIDYSRTGDGVIVCTDGFVARTISPEEFRRLAGELCVKPMIAEVDESSVFCEFFK